MAQATKRVTESWWYTLPSDLELPAGEQSRFRLSPLTYSERARVYDQREVIRRSDGNDRTIETRLFTVASELALTHLEEVENFPASDPKPWPKDGTREAKEKYLSMLSDADILDLGIQIWTKSTLGDAEKNS